jgi:formylmethanofuran dehydrogenase subunit B
MLVVDVRETTSARASDRFFRIRPGVDFELLTVLRVLVNGQPFDQGLVDRSGAQLTDLAELAGRMKRARLGVLDRSRGYPRRTAWLHFTAASPGIHAAGTAYRMDKVPLPMRSVLRSAHATDEDILHGIRHALTPSRARQMKISPLPGTLASPV